jgi:hypothetical protein
VTEQGIGNSTRLYVRLAPAIFVVGLGFMLSQVFANAGPASADDPSNKITICHATGSNTNPFVLITVDEHAAPAHLGGPNLNGNGQADHKGHGDIKLNPGSVNAGTIGHGPITAAECDQLAGGAATLTEALPTSTATAEPEESASGTPKGAQISPNATDESEDVETPVNPHPTHGTESTTPNGSGPPPARRSTQSTAVHSTEVEHQSTGVVSQPQLTPPGGASTAATFVPQQHSTGGTGSNNAVNPGNGNQQSGPSGAKGNGGANTPGNQSNGASQHDAGGHKPASQPTNQGHNR